MLNQIQVSLGGIGRINSHGSMVHYRVNSIKDLAVLIDYLDKYPLLTQKKLDFLLFKQVVEMINRKEHLTTEGLRKIVSIRASINKGLTAELKAAFPSIIPVSRLKIEGQEIKDPN